jgi:hypothetical protein
VRLVGYLKRKWIQKFSRTKVNNALALPVLTYCSEIGTLKEYSKRIIPTAIKFFRIAAFLTINEMKEFWKI